MEEAIVVADFLDQTRAEITKRLKELEPLVDEFRRLEDAASALAGVAGSAVRSVRDSVTGAPRRRGPGRPPGSATTAAAPAKKRGRPAGRPKKAAATTATSAAPTRKPRRAGRRKGSGGRAAQALSFIKAQPGITIPELATKMGIKSQYLYRLLPPLEQDGKITKQGKGLYPV
jgi:hypothetical protein